MFNFTGGARRKSVQGADIRRILTVELVEARQLLGLSKNGTSDPIVELALTDLGGREIKKEVFRSKQKTGTVSPAWNEKFTFGQTYNLDTTGDLPTLNVALFHKAPYSVSETPLGVVRVPLESIDPKCAETDQWYRVESDGRMKAASGEVHIKLKFNVPPTDREIEVDLETGTDDPNAAENMEEIEAQLPNELHVHVLQARRLPAANKNFLSGGGASSDPLVQLKIENNKVDSKVVTTSYLSKTINPVWNEKFVFMVENPQLALNVKVEDKETLKNNFLGRIDIPISAFDNKQPSKQWYKLLNKTREDDGQDRGEIELLIHWKYSTQAAQVLREKQEKEDNKLTNKLAKMANNVGEFVGLKEGSDDEVDPDDMEEEKEGETKREATPEEKAEEEKKVQEKKKELEDIEIKPGDYQVQIHIIEARELKAENYNGTSDPIIFIECFKQKRNTVVIKNVTSAVYDELFIFNVKEVTKDMFEQATIRISCFDSNMLSNKGTMIGAYAFDATSVYTMNKDHEMYRQWVPLMDDEDPADTGVQGYLKISVQIIGPGEKVKVHDEEAERAAEIARESKAGSDIGSLMLSTPTIIKEWKFLVVRIYKAEGLPIMDGKVGVGIVTAKKAGTDAFCKLNFAGGKPLKTKVVTASGDTRSLINPYFNAELWYPISVPTMTQVIRVSMWDKDETGPSELIGNIIERLNNVKKANRQCMDIQWYNMYGCHEFKQEKLLANMKKGVKIVANKAKQTFGADIDWSDYYNNTPEKASSFKGRLLMQVSLVDKRPPKFEKKEVAPFRRKLPALLSKYEPKTEGYVLQALVLSGAEMPNLGNITSSQYRVKITIGINEASTKPVKVDSGMCRWGELIKTTKLNLPVDLKQLPDIFIYLVREDNKPICFKRLSPTIKNEKGEMLLMGFEAKCDWVLLQEDKAVDALNKDVFPGNILMKLGFGLAVEAEKAASAWKQDLELSKQAKPFQMRVHIYQARNLPAADSNGLCDPFFKVNFQGNSQKTVVKKKTLYPVYYQTLVYDNVVIPDYDSFTYASQVCVRFYDEDTLDGDDYLGTTFFHLKDAILTEDPDATLPDPTWKSFFFEVPGDSQGEVLMQVQLIPTKGGQITAKPKPINPPSRSAFIEFLVIGMRDMAPYNFQNIQNPFLSVELNSFGTTFLSETKTSKHPEPMNPNFLEHIMMPVELPENSIYTTPLLIKAKDTRLGGYLKPIVGVCEIDLFHKLPWCEENYKPPRTDLFFNSNTAPVLLADGKEANNPNIPLSNADEVALKAIELQNMREGVLIEDDYVASQAPIAVDEYINDRVKQDDTGAGIFGALNHIAIGKYSAKEKKDLFADPGWEIDEGDQPPAWMKNRDKLESELEVKFETSPFETYNLMRGQVNGFLGSTLKVVGRLKGLVRVVASKEAAEKDPLLPKELMQQLLKPKSYVVRLYALRAFQLTEMDVDLFGRKSKSDPYLRVKLGKKLFNDRQNAVEDVLEVDLYKVIVLETELPGISRLNIDIVDKDLIGSDDLIGSTSVDLEDRWFDNRWQVYGEDNMVLPGKAGDGTKVRWKTKPIERRTLYAPGQTQSQGIFECYVDIMTPEEASAFLPDDVALPPKQIFEVRVVIWKTKNVPPMDSFEGMSDLFVKCWPEGCDPQETDTHWRCKKGKASFNWRMLFDVELGHNTRAMKFPYLHLQLWDRDVVKWNDCAGEGIIDLGKFYRKAYKRNIAIKLFEKKKGMTAKRAKKDKEKVKREDLLIDNGEDIPPEELGGVEGEGQEEDEGRFDVISPLRPSAAQPTGGYVTPATLLPPRDAVDSDDDEEEGGAGAGRDARLDSGVGALPPNLKRGESRMVKVEAKKKAPPAKAAAAPAAAAPTGIWRYVYFWRKAPKEEEKGLLEGEEKKEGEEGGEGGEKSEEEKKEDEDSEMKEMVTSFKNMTGLWDIDPDDSAWYHLEQKDKNDPTKIIPMGSICYSVQIWPKDKAVVMAVGAARKEPNTNPFLPPPVGRLKFSWNPFVLGSELCGPVLCAKFFCCLLCLTFITLMIFCQPFLNIIINLIFVVY